MMTGQKQVRARPGFSDYDSMGSGNYAAAMTGNLDAPDYMPQGSVRLHSTARPNPAPSIACRDWENKPIGCPHDGPETAATVMNRGAA